MRRRGDQLAWAAIRLSAGKGEARVVLLEDAAGEEAPIRIETISCPPVEYDEIVAMMAWADKVVVW